jgi:hypothetical protein
MKQLAFTSCQKSSVNHKAEVVKKISSFPDGWKHRLHTRQGGYAKSEIITSSLYNNEVEMKRPTKVRKKAKPTKSKQSDKNKRYKETMTGW